MSDTSNRKRLQPAALWHLAWACALGAAGLALAATFPGSGLGAALTAGVIPGLAGALLLRDRPAKGATLVLALWALGCAIACALTGGVQGPWAVLCLTPVAAAGAIGGARRLAEGAAAAVAAGAAQVLVSASGRASPPPAGLEALWMGVTAIVLVGGFLGAGLLMERGRRAARERRDQEEQLRLSRLLEQQPVLQAVVTPEGAIHNLFGRAPEAVDKIALRRDGLLSLADEAARPGLAEALAQAARIGASRYAFAPATALDRWLVADIRTIGRGDLAVLLRDASLEHAREAALEQAKADAEAMAAGKSRFLANMSHELRTPLNAIIGFSDIMRAAMFGPLTPRYAEYAQLIHESGGHLLDLINDVLDMSKVEADRFELSTEPFDARDAISGAVRLMHLGAERSGITLRSVLPPRPLAVVADRRALKQIVLNLISNAVKFTPKGGAVTVMARQDGEVLELSVSDTGVGISPDDLVRLGRPYEQAGGAEQKSLGTGLGLSLVRAFAELHGGGMTIESQQGEGTSVTVRMPVLKEAPRPPASDTPLLDYGDNVVAFQPGR